MLTNLFSLLPVELEQGPLQSFPKYRTQQLLAWMYKAFENDLKKMTNLPADLKTLISSTYSLDLPHIESHRKSADGAIKYLLKLSDGALIECVLIPERKKNTLCISTQVGCARGCGFCSTARMKLVRNLETHEIVGQIIIAAKELARVESFQPASVESFQPASVESFQPLPNSNLSPNSKAERTTHNPPFVVHSAAKNDTYSNQPRAESTPNLHPTPRITNLVFMGMGEPFDNQDNVFKTLQIIQSDGSLAFSPRRTTISTCGIVPGIIAMADSGIKAKLAISLNSAIDEKRNTLMPINKR